MSAGVIVADNWRDRPWTVGLSWEGVRLKREYGGPPWFRGINGVRIVTRRKVIWLEFRKRSGREAFEDRRHRGRLRVPPRHS